MNVTVRVSDETLASLLCNAFEGGSNYWYMIDEFHKPLALSFRTDKEHVYKHIDYPMNIGGYLLISTLEGDEISGKKQWKLDKVALRRGLAVLAEKVPHQFAQILDESDDSSTADCFLQCALFGEVIFG